MKRYMALFLSLMLILTGCLQCNINSLAASTLEENVIEVPEFTDLSDESLLRYVQDEIYAELVNDLNSDEYFVENVSAVYLSKEYLEEVAFNSQANIYFGYTLEELNEQFEGARYVFTLGENGETGVEEFEAYDDIFEEVVENVAIGTGVILVCVTVAVVTAGAGVPAVSMIFAASAKSGAIFAASSSALSGVAAGVMTGIETGDFKEAVKAGALAGSESFKWGAITGVISGGASEVIALKGATMNGLTMNQAAAIQKESGYPLDVIKQFGSMEQYEVCKAAGLKSTMLNGKTALLRKIDFDQVDEFGFTNLERMLSGQAPLDPTGAAYELHHVGQKVDSTLAILTKEEHRLGDSYKVWHKIVESGEGVHSQMGNAAWDKVRKDFWKAFAKMSQVGGI